ncbi:fibrous sheath CABYR-binding protein-like isoform X3 [Sphaeramia orbicularis]|nr:fibrous sheath CABYR-binding protein-like isoform X3 [Sphaeramia orbicularis]
MASEEDEALLFLIYQHLKVNGYKKAAKGLEKHVTQVETPEDMSNLHDIYTGWMKLCSLAQHAKEETGDSSPVKKTVKCEPATSEEEGPESKHSNTTEEEDVDAKPILDEVEPSTVDDQLLGPTPEIQITNKEEKRKEEIQMEQESALVFAEEPNNVENPSSDSSDCAGAVEPPQGESSSVSPDQPDPDPAPDQTQTLDPAPAPSPVSEEPDQDADELQQEPEADAAETSDQTPVSQTLAPPPCTQEPIEPHSSETGEGAPEEDPGQAPPTATAEPNEKPADMEAPPPTDPETDSTGENQQEEVEEQKCEDPKVDDLTPSVNPEVQMETSSSDPADPSLSVHVQEMEAAVKEQADPDSSILLNIVGDVSAEVTESCGDQTPKKKKKKKKKKGNAETAATDTSTSETTSETSTKSPKKKKKDKNKEQEEQVEVQEDGEEEQVEVQEDGEVAQEALSEKKKKAKKRKRDEEVEKDEKEHIIPVETKSKKKKMKDVEEEKEEEEHPVSLTDTAAKKKKRRKRKKGGPGTEEVHSAEQPAEGDTDKDMTLEAADGGGSQLHSAKKKRLRKKLSLKKRLRIQKYERRSSSAPVESQTKTFTSEKK